MNAHFPALMIILPLMAAPLCLLLRNGRAARFLAVAVAWTCLGLACTVLDQVIHGEIFSYMLGGWAAPYGIT